MSLFLHDSCTILHISCKTEVVQYFARDAARITTCKFGVSCTFFCKILQELVQDCARIVKEKGHVPSSLACKIRAQSCMILHVRFCWASSYAACSYSQVQNLQGGEYFRRVKCEFAKALLFVVNYKDQNKKQLSIRSEVSPISPGNAISCSPGHAWPSIFGECDSLPVLDRSACT